MKFIYAERQIFGVTGQEEKETGKLSVHVIEENSGLDVPDALVEVTGEDGKTRTYRTNENGEIVDENGETPTVPAGKYTIKITEVPEGYDVKTGEVGEVEVPKNEEGHHDAVIATTRGGIVIEVLDEDTDEPVPGAKVRVITPDGEEHIFITDEEGKIDEYAKKDEFGNYTAEDGKYTYTVIEVPDGYQVTVGKEQEGEVTPGKLTELEAKIAPKTGGLDITVVDENTEKPVPGAVVEVVYPDGSTHTFTTDEEGRIDELIRKNDKGRYTAKIGTYKITVIRVPDGYKVTTGETKEVTVEQDKEKHHIAKIKPAPKPEKQPEKRPQTGDDTPITMLFILMMISAAGFAGVVVKKKKAAHRK